MNRSAALALISSKSLTNTFTLAVMGSLLLWISAKIQVPFWPVPLTLQTLVVVLLPVFLGARAGIGAVALYMIEGAFGLPVFAGTPQLGIGLAYMAGPTGGFLAGFMVAASAIAIIAPALKRTFLNGFIMAAIGHAIIFACGIPWLSQFVGLQQALAVGLFPFVAATVVKVGMAACAVKLINCKALRG